MLHISRSTISGAATELSSISSSWRSRWARRLKGSARRVLGGSGQAIERDGAQDPSTARASIYVWVPDVDEHHSRAKAAGAEITLEPTDMSYGSREYAARDFEGHHWSFGSYLPRPDAQ